jgi:pimeloyl-ACP methyl ester carboxylesterase
VVLVSAWYLSKFQCNIVYANHAQVLKWGKHTQTIVSAGPDADNDTARYFDVISFDPRGVNNTRPNLQCFPNFIERVTFEKEMMAYGAPGSSNTAFTNLWTLVRTLADSCSKKAIESGIGEHMSTTSVARDIVEIFERHGEWREQEARKLLKSSDKSEKDLPDHVKYQPGEEMVQYWGFSYGTVLGATLADMYPDRVKRVILDGVVDSFDYYEGGWTTNLQDTDMEIAKFAEYCWQGGPKNCALYDEDGPAFIYQRFADITQNLMHNPIGVPGTDEYGSDMGTYTDLKMLLWETAYRPLMKFHALAETMAQLEKGNGTALVQARRGAGAQLKQGLSEQCEKDGPYSDACNPYYAGESSSLISAAVLCSDAESQIDMTKEEFWDYVQELMKQSKMMGDVWTTIRMHCTQVSSSCLTRICQSTY